eukprot:14556477-Alexandrium_andersonii.AAC.1
MQGQWEPIQGLLLAVSPGWGPIAPSGFTVFRTHARLQDEEADVPTQVESPAEPARLERKGASEWEVVGQSE